MHYHPIITLCISAALLSACTPTPIATPVEVKIPVAVPCVVTPLPEPDWAIAKLKPNAAPAVKLRAALVDLYLSKIYIRNLKAELAACT